MTELMSDVVFWQTGFSVLSAPYAWPACKRVCWGELLKLCAQHHKTEHSNCMRLMQKRCSAVAVIKPKWFSTWKQKPGVLPFVQCFSVWLTSREGLSDCLVATIDSMAYWKKLSKLNLRPCNAFWQHHECSLHFILLSLKIWALCKSVVPMWPLISNLVHLWCDILWLWYYDIARLRWCGF